VRFDDDDLTGATPAQIVAGGIVQVPEGRRIFGRLTVEENLRAGGMGNRDRAARRPHTPGCTTCSPCSPSAARSGGAAVRR
jgi:ABC-type branched-subunit amino acid transport system ATPase component